MRDAYVLILISVITLGASIGLSLPTITLLPGIAGLAAAAAIVRVGAQKEEGAEASMVNATEITRVHSAA